MTGFESQDNGHWRKHWYVMRDLKRANAKLPAYKMLEALNFEVFTPMRWRVTLKQGKRVREEVPFIQDLLFVHSEKRVLDLVVEKYSTLQYRYQKGGGYCEPMVVRDKEMDDFIHAVNSTASPFYYSPQEITSGMIGHKVRIIGGALDGYETVLLKIKGSKKRRILVELSQLVAVSVEVEPEYIQLL